jgi:hypothetical protein
MTTDLRRLRSGENLAGKSYKMIYLLFGYYFFIFSLPSTCFEFIISIRQANLSILGKKDSLSLSIFFDSESIDGISNFTLWAEPEETSFFPTEIAA